MADRSPPGRTLSDKPVIARVFRPLKGELWGSQAKFTWSAAHEGDGCQSPERRDGHAARSELLRATVRGRQDPDAVLQDGDRVLPVRRT